MTTVQLLSHGIYDFSEASRLTKVSPQRVRAWFEGWPRRGRGPALRTDFAALAGGQRLISFLDLVEVLIAGQLREKGMSLQYLRRAYQALESHLETEHPFSHRELLTDGKQLFIRVANDTGDIELSEAVARQQAFDEVLRPYLERIDWDEQTRLARRWQIMDGVVLDPLRRFGKPIVQSIAIPTTVLSAAYRANGHDYDLVADWYGVTPQDVKTAVEFEHQFFGKAA